MRSIALLFAIAGLLLSDAPAVPAPVGSRLVPDYALRSHIAPPGLGFYDGDRLAVRSTGGAFIGLHGAWNRGRFADYKVIFVPFRSEEPFGLPTRC